MTRPPNIAREEVIGEDWREELRAQPVRSRKIRKRPGNNKGRRGADIGPRTFWREMRSGEW